MCNNKKIIVQATATRYVIKMSRMNGNFYSKCRQAMQELDREYEDAKERHRRAGNSGRFNLVPFPDIDMEPEPYAAGLRPASASATAPVPTSAPGVSNTELGQDFLNIVNINNGSGDGNNYDTNNSDQEDINLDGDSCVDFDDDMVGRDDAYDFIDEMDLIDNLRYLVVTCQLPRSTANLLLAILRKKLNLDLPKDARTLVKTPTGIGKIVKPIPGGDYWYGGLKSVLAQHLQNVNPGVTPFSLDVSIDGLPLHRAGPTQLWPILVKVVELPKVPVMMVATFSGASKPGSIIPYLEPFIDELNLIQREGLVIGDKTVHFRVRAFIADSPARAFLKGKSLEYKNYKNIAIRGSEV
ncbi:uncharacterized protein LOC125774343 [Anopheles funestus]|uniref:uncharacterized protein LOC125774343 n=1 Tax=Anopheles funestus TaxID=62324 RepID=UPI0020C6137D|nr:uncharacterized protein LOC125774343 [Anopheles funestus]